MSKHWRIAIFICAIFGALHSRSAASAEKQAKPRSVSGRVVSDKKTSTKNKQRGNPVRNVTNEFKMGKISAKKTWITLENIKKTAPKLSTKDKLELMQTQSEALLRGGYPITAAIFASQAVALADNPLSNDVKSAWLTLRKVSEIRPIQNFLEVVAETTKLPDQKFPQAFGTNWNYYVANSLSRNNNRADAIKYYDLVKPLDRDYLAAKYQQAMLLLEQEKTKEAEEKLNLIINYSDMNPALKDRKSTENIVDYARLSSARIHYEQQRFQEAISQYRLVRRNGFNFYDALFEQSWAFFMGGYPMHALGALYAVESPFFDQVFNPEAPILRALIHYWLCRYDDSRSALADFAQNYANDVEKLNEFLNRKRLATDDAYQLFENFLTGVSEESLGISKSILKTAAEKESMLLVRDQYAAIIEERKRLESKGLFGSQNFAVKPIDYMQRWSSALQSDIGKIFLAELQDIKADYEQLYSQAEFLYVELLMSEKDQLLGKELHAATKITQVSKRLKVSGWADKTQSWKDSRIGEYWWDEVGFYISPVESQCIAKK